MPRLWQRPSGKTKHRFQELGKVLVQMGLEMSWVESFLLCFWKYTRVIWVCPSLEILSFLTWITASELLPKRSGTILHIATTFFSSWEIPLSFLLYLGLKEAALICIGCWTELVNCTNTPVQIPNTSCLIMYSWHMEPCWHRMAEFLAQHAAVVNFLPQCFLMSASILWRIIFLCCKYDLSEHPNSCKVNSPHFESTKAACNFPERE